MAKRFYLILRSERSERLEGRAQSGPRRWCNPSLAGYGLARHVSTQSVLGSSWPVGTMPSSHVGMMKGSAR